MTRSLIFKLTLTYIAIILLVSFLVGGFLPIVLRENFFRLKEREMVNRANQLSAMIEKQTEENGTDSLDQMLDVLQTYSGDRIIILYRDGEWLDIIPGTGKGKRRITRQAWSFLASDEINQLWEGRPLIRRSVQSPTTDSPGQNILSVAVPIHDQKNPDRITGAVFINTPVQGIMQISQSTYRWSLLLLIASALLAMVASFYLSRTVSRPLRQMNRAAQALAQGDYKHRVDVSSDDEVGELSTSFNRLARRLEEASLQTAQLEQMRRDFVANVSHELRAPLTLIRGYTEALLDEALEPGADPRSFYQIIREEALRMERLISELLDLSRLEAGKVNLTLEEVDLAVLARQMVDRVSPRAKDQGIELRLESTADLPPVRGDSRRLEQLLIIFLDNALKYTPSGGSIIVRLEDESDLIRVSVQDTGRGIPPQDIPYIWERFYKVDKAHSREDSGTGLGLAIARQLIEMHQGKLAVTSELNRGSVFSFTLPKYR